VNRTCSSLELNEPDTRSSMAATGFTDVEGKLIKNSSNGAFSAVLGFVTVPRDLRIKAPHLSSKADRSREKNAGPMNKTV
jgi:hypothetical protein